jgi:hypothetical protein
MRRSLGKATIKFDEVVAARDHRLRRALQTSLEADHHGHTLSRLRDADESRFHRHASNNLLAS